MEYDVDLGCFKIDAKFLEDLFLIGDDIQKISIIETLPQLIASDSPAVFSRVIPKIKQDLPNSSCEFQLSASAIFKTVLQRSGNTNVLQSILQGIDSKDPNVALSWADALFASVSSLPEVVIQNNLLPLAKQKCTHTSPVVAKIFCCRLIDEICSSCSKFRLIDVKKDILPLVTGLCQDVNPDIRAQVCSILPNVVKSLGNDVEKTNLLSCIVELAQDENINVRSTSIVAITPMLNILNNEISRNTLLPLIKKLCSKACEDSLVTAFILSNEYGSLMKGCQNISNEQDVMFFVRVYKQLSLKGKQTSTSKANASKEVTIRQKCASNTAELMKLLMQIHPTQIQDLYTSFREHAIDPCYLVRRAAAGSLSEIAQLLGKDNKIMKNEIVRLLRDDAVEVLDALVPTIYSIFSSLASSEVINYNEANQATTEFGKALIKCHTELTKSYNWRLTVEFMKQLEVLPMCMPGDYIHGNFTPVLFEKMVNGKAKPVRIQAARTLVVFMRYNFKANQNKWIRESLIRQTSQSKSCHSRILHFYLCEAVLSVYSDKFFKEFFLPTCLALSGDKIANVRWKFMQFSTKLKAMVSLATDQQTKQKIMDTITKLESTEKSKIVQDIIKSKKREPPPKYLAEALKEEERRVKEETTTNIKSALTPAAQKPQALAATGDAKHVNINPDMRFLKQHFYIDTGIKLETIDVHRTEFDYSPPNILSDISHFGTNDFIQIETTNITDDVKVNLRNIKSKLTPPASYHESNNITKMKRHSSVISSTSMECEINHKTFQRRRSLSFCNSNNSKIPIANRTKFTNSLMKSNQGNNNDTIDIMKELQIPNSLVDKNVQNRISNIKPTSHLPVYTRATKPAAPGAPQRQPPGAGPPGTPQPRAPQPPPARGAKSAPPPTATPQQRPQQRPSQPTAPKR